MKLNKTLTFLGLCLVSLQMLASNITLQSKRLSVNDGLSCNTVNDIKQDKDGYIWFATTNGFSRFDGYSFVNFTRLGIGEKVESASNISQLLNDEHNGLIWGYTPQKTIFCYELQKGKFVDYTGIGDFKRPFRNKCISQNGLWLYDDKFGVRHIIFNKGKYSIKDYTEENGLLPSKRGLIVNEDKDYNIWITSAKGLMRITPNGQRQILLKGKDIRIRTINEQYYAVLTNKGEAYLFNLNGKLLLRSQLPSMLGTIEKSRANMFWNGAWYIFTTKETFAMDLKTGRFFKPEIQIANAIDKNALSSYHCFYDKQGNLYLFNKKKNWMKKLALMSNPSLIMARDKNFSVAEDANGRIFIASYGNGLYVYTPQEDRLQHFTSKDKEPLFDTDFLLNIFIDQSNCVWASSGYGVFCIKEVNDLDAEYVRIAPSSDNEWSNYIRHVNYIGNNLVILTNKNHEYFTYNTKTGNLSRLGNATETIYSYRIDSKGHTWIGTKGAGFTVDGRTYSQNLKNAPSSRIYDFAFDKLGRTWIATWEDGLLLTQQQGNQPLKFCQYMTEETKESQLHALFMGKKNRLWICSNNGIAMVDANKKGYSKKDFLHFNSSTSNLPTNQIICGFEGKDGTLWFGTNSGVLKCHYDEKCQKLSFELLSTSNGLINNTVRSLSEDSHGYIWVATEEGISRINSKTMSMKSFVLGKLFSENAYTENCTTHLPDGRLVFGSENGMLILKPIKQRQEKPDNLKVTITDLTINGISIFKEEMSEISEEAINYAKEISLPHDKNSLSISFSNFNYPEIGSTIYQYYLEGIDKTWRPATSLNHADFSDLQPGSYTLHLRTLNSNNEWSEETLLAITIRQPWYNTWWAWMIYLIILGGIGLFLYREWRKNFELNQQMKLEKQMSNFRIDFFTHISHEFRTPLAIIQSTVEKLTAAGEGYVNKPTLRTLNRGTKRMQRLINQLMEFRKINTGNMKLSVEEGDIVVFIRNIFNDIYAIAKQKDINMNYTPSLANYRMSFDTQKVETIVYNLLSNAVKYTPDKGNIIVKLNVNHQNVEFSVEDNGPGIKPEREQELFKPFMHGYVSKGGMGIGLYTAHEMASIHKGTLTYQRSTNLGGSLFTLTLPSKTDVYAPEDFTERSALDKKSIERDEIDTIVKEMTPQAINDVTVMVIEDDPDMMEQIKSELSIYFKVVGYMNGKTGYENIKKIKPALLICDIMLPEMSGYEIVSNLKSDPETQALPVIMLTAFDDASHILKAYKSFVDDYMVKPCNFKLLIARALQFVATDMKEKKRAKESEKRDKETQVKPVKEIQPTEPSLLMSTLDKKFKDKLEAIVAQHISDCSFSVDRLAELLNLGRTTVYNRTKSIMGISPNMYIQNERLRIAAQMLLEGEYTVTEISEKVGFSDSTYFYKCFKNKFGVAPSKYGK